MGLMLGQETWPRPSAHQFEIELHVFLFEHGVDTLHLVGDA